MGVWPYQILDLDPDQKRARRELIDYYAAIAHFSALVPVVFALLLRLAAWVAANARSPTVAYTRLATPPSSASRRPAGLWSRTVRSCTWWLAGPAIICRYHVGRRDQLISSVVWLVWLSSLCVVHTGRDYLHLTKRFGAVAVSQLPMQYLLSLKGADVISCALRSSHEKVNLWHRALGRLIYILLCIHALLYLNYYYQKGILLSRIGRTVPLLGLVALISFGLLVTTSMSIVRRYSYRVFFVTHLLVALVLPILVFFHADTAWLYAAEMLVVLAANLGTRRWATFTVQATVDAIPNTCLVKVVLKVPSERIQQFCERPGAHVYLSTPAAARPSSKPISLANLQFNLIFSPFSVATVNEHSAELVLVAKARAGPASRNLVRLAHVNPPRTNISLCIEGPYGCAARFPNLAGPEFGRVLLVAGGIGSTFVVPLYHAIRAENPDALMKMIWAVRSAGEATWPVSSNPQSRLVEDDDVELFLTGHLFDGEGDEIELERIAEARRQGTSRPGCSRKRPDLGRIVGDVFKAAGEEATVAVVVCGPDEMVQDLRSHVGEWVRQGRKVWWHDEAFAW